MSLYDYKFLKENISMNPTPLVSVHMITYNHAKFIRQAIEGALNQNTSFPFEIVIGEDCSTDGTKEIVHDYQQRYPEIINITTSKKNVGVNANFIRTLNACKGKYVALCEGDDYWTDPQKLQKQVDFLENNPDFVICCHDVKVIYENVEEIWPFSTSNLNNIFSFNDVLKRHFIPTNSLVFKNGIVKKYPVDISGIISFDILHELLLTLNGRGYYFFEQMAVKRKHENGITQKIKRKKQDIILQKIKIYKGLLEFAHGTNRVLVRGALGFYYYRYFKILKKTNQQKAIMALLNSIILLPYIIYYKNK